MVNIKICFLNIYRYYQHTPFQLKNKFVKRIYVLFLMQHSYFCYLQSTLKEIMHAFVRISFEDRYDFCLSVISFFRTFLKRCESTPAQLRAKNQLFCLYTCISYLYSSVWSLVIRKKNCELHFIFQVETHIGAWFSYQTFLLHGKLHLLCETCRMNT